MKFDCSVRAKATLARLAVLLPLVSLSAVSCDSVYYATLEKFGYAKRDLLIERVEEGREDQAAAKEEIKSTFEAFKALTNFDGGELETLYKQLKGQLEDSESAAGKVTKRIASIEKVSEAMFSEWATEIETISNDKMRRDSQALKRSTEQDYDRLIRSMRQAEAKMEPVLQVFRDHVTYLKHQLNAKAINSLQDDLSDIESNVEGLIKEMEASIDQANAFISSMN